MTEKAHFDELPPPYPGATGLSETQQSPPYTDGAAVLPSQQPAQPVPGQYTQPNPTATGGQTNYGLYGSQQRVAQPMYYGQQQQQQQQQQQTQYSNVVMTQVGGMGGPVYQAPPYDYTTQAFIACLCCFWPTGLVAIMKASESRDAAARGDMMAAHQSANSARQMIRISYVVGIISFVFAAIFVGVYVGVIMNNLNDGWNN